MFKSIKNRYFLKEKEDMCYFTSKKNLEYIHRELKKYDKTSDACESLKIFKNKNKIHEFQKRMTELNQIWSFESNEYCWAGIAKAMRTCQKHDMRSACIGIGNERTIVLCDRKSIINYISLDCELRLRTLNEIIVIEYDDEKMIKILKYNDFPETIFRRKCNSTNYLMISTAYLTKSQLNVLKENDDLKKKELRSYTSIKLIHIM